MSITNNIVAAFSSIQSDKSDAASEMPSIAGKKILMGFWHNWPAGASDGYQRGQFAELALEDVPKEYNVVAVAFMKGSGIPTFKPYNVSDEEFRRQVGVLNSQGRAVLISLGGADAHIELRTGHEGPLAQEIIRLVETYGFDGLDIDLEQNAIDFSDNRTVLPAALKLVKDHYHAQGLNFIISMAPEFPYLVANGKYFAYIDALDGYYDFIAPQIYNQGGDGLWVAEANGGQGAWIAQNNDAVKEDFLYYLTESLVTGTRGYIKIPYGKFVIGLPSNNDAAATGYVIDPKAVANTLRRLDAAGLPIKGLMTWSVNWDNGKSKDGKDYNWEFRNRYAPLIHGGNNNGDGDGNNHNNNGNDGDVPAAPTNLASPAQTESSITLSWNASKGTSAIKHYTVYRNGNIVKTTSALTFEDRGLNSNTLYDFFVTSTDNLGHQSLPSNSIRIKTNATELPVPEYAEWKPGRLYRKGDEVSYKNKRYVCRNEHTSIVSWEPGVALSLWLEVV